MALSDASLGWDFPVFNQVMCTGSCQEKWLYGEESVSCVRGYESASDDMPKFVCDPVLSSKTQVNHMLQDRPTLLSYMGIFHLERGFLCVQPDAVWRCESAEDFRISERSNHWKYVNSLHGECCFQEISQSHAFFTMSKRLYTRKPKSGLLGKRLLSIGAKVKQFLFLGWKMEDISPKFHLIASEEKNWCMCTLQNFTSAQIYIHLVDPQSGILCNDRGTSNLEIAEKTSAGKDSVKYFLGLECTTRVYGNCRPSFSETSANDVVGSFSIKRKRKRQIELNENMPAMRTTEELHVSSKGWEFDHGENCEVVGSTNIPNSNGFLTLPTPNEVGSMRFSDSVNGSAFDYNGDDNFHQEHGCLSSLAPKAEYTKDSPQCLALPEVHGFGKLEMVRKGKRRLRKRRKYREVMAHVPLLQSSHNEKESAIALVMSGQRSYLKCPARVLRSSKRALHVVEGHSSAHPSVRSVLSWLIDNDIILPRQKVFYRNSKEQAVMAEGTVTREGIKCKCCKKVYSLARFEAHAGSGCLRAMNNIILSDGRSLLECQMRLLRDKKDACKNLYLNAKVRADRSYCSSDDICSICYTGGVLISCSCCPSSFHPGCINLQHMPQGQWCCISCRCRMCYQSDYDAKAQCFTPQSILYCDQCEREYHVKCIKERMKKLEMCPLGNWFCSRKCSKIFKFLQTCLGRRKPINSNGLSWTILRSRRINGCHFDASAVEAIVEHQSKLWVALSVLHECFVPVVEPLTRRDLLTDVIFSNWSELRRLNFQGFYTVLLEKDDELVSVALLRIYGEKVAEMPLIATHVSYRRQGMCRLLMKELEKMLIDLEVERLILPAVPQLLETWTSSFGFTLLPHSGRVELLEFTFLGFEGTTMCQKLLSPFQRKIKKPGGQMQAMQVYGFSGIVPPEDMQVKAGNYGFGRFKGLHYTRRHHKWRIEPL